MTKGLLISSLTKLPKARVFRDSPLSRHLLADATLALLTQLALPDGVSQAHRHAPHRLHMQGSQLICSACFLGMSLSAKEGFTVSTNQGLRVFCTP